MTYLVYTLSTFIWDCPNLPLDVQDNLFNNNMCSQQRIFLPALGRLCLISTWTSKISLQLILPAPSPLSRTKTWLTIPLALRRGSHPHTRVVEPFVGAVLVVARHHVPVGNLVAYAISWLVGIVVPLLIWTLTRGVPSTTKTGHWGGNAGQGRRCSNLRMQD